MFDVMSAKHLKEWIDEVNALSGIRVPFLGKEEPKDREGCPLMDHRQDQKINGKTPEHPVGSVHRENMLIVGQK